MKILNKLNVLIYLLVSYSSSAFAVEYLQDFPDARPLQIFADNAGKFYVDYGDYVYIYDQGRTDTIRLTTVYGNMRVNYRDTTVTGSGLIITYVLASYTVTYPITVNGTTTYSSTTYSDRFLEFCNPGCTHHRVSGKLSDEGFIKDVNGNVYFKIAGGSGARYYINQRTVSKSEYDSAAIRSSPVKIYTKTSEAPFNVGDPDIVIHYPKDGAATTHTARFRGKRSIVWDSGKIPHVFYHDPGDRIFRHTYYNDKSHDLVELVVDQKESGYENLAFVEGDSIWTINYFYRNALTKGLLATRMDNTGQITRQFVLDASQSDNIGWNLAGARAPNGRLLLSYATNGESGKQIYLLLSGTDELTQMGNNLASFGHVRGSDYAGQLTQTEQQEIGHTLAEGYLKDYKSFALSAGVGAQYAFWQLMAERDTHYDINNSIVNLVEFQSKFYDIDYGFEIARNSATTQTASADNTGVAQYASAYIGWDKLLYNYDFKLNLEQGKTRVRFTYDPEQLNINYEMNYSSIKLSLLSQQRRQFGFEYQHFNQYRKIDKYTYNSGAGWQYNSSGIGELDTKVYLGHYGYSTLSYLEKYGVKENRWYIDLEGKAGVVQHEYKGSSTAAWGARPDFDIAIMVGGQFEAGWIWFQRWSSMKALGGYVKVGYRVNLDFYPDEKPNDQYKGDEGETRYTLGDAYLLRHGPLAMIGLNF